MGEFLSTSVVLMIISSALFLVSWISKLAYSIWWRPKQLEKCLKQQGIVGAPYKLLYGDQRENVKLLRDARSKPMPLSHLIVPRVAPFLLQTLKKYGNTSLTWFGTHPRVNIIDPDLIREILSHKFGHFQKSKTNPLIRLLVSGLASYDGEKWAKHRRIINPAFHLEKLKRMLPAFSESCGELISRWENLIGPDGSIEMDMWPEMESLTADVISRTAFGSNYKEGNRIFHLQKELAKIISDAAQSVNPPVFSYFLTKQDIRRKEIDREVRALLTGIIKKREKDMKMGEAPMDDLLGLLMESNLQVSQQNGNSRGMTIEDVIEECKLFYFAGQETTSVLLTWTMVVLSMHPKWQTLAREEVLQVFGNKKPDFDGLNHLKIVTMILYEVLRLYPPAIMLVRTTSKRTRLGNFSFPPGVQLLMPLLLVHRNRDVWGEDADEFKPERFYEGTSKACKNQQAAFFPFGWGPRICVGQNFALIEAKLALAMILQHFSFELSPSYAHAPWTVITLQPQYGAQIIFHRL